jgi:hypothetical protein
MNYIGILTFSIHILSNCQGRGIQNPLKERKTRNFVSELQILAKLLASLPKIFVPLQAEILSFFR